MAKRSESAVYELLTRGDDGAPCKDIPDAACDEQPGNFLKHVVALAATKTGDGLADPKLVLSWLLTSLGAPAFLIGLLVPIREAGSLLPQLFISARVQTLPVRKWVWVTGSFLQGVSILGMAGAVFVLDAVAASWSIIGFLALFALARSACSVSYKDVLGKTVSKATRGTATGTASSVSALAVLAFGIVLTTGLIDVSISVLALALLAAGILWLAAAFLFSTLMEVASETDGSGSPATGIVEQFSLFKEDGQLRLFVVTRGLLLSTALAPPFFLSALGQDGTDNVGDLGPFVLASAVAAMSSGYVWGRLSDLSSRKVLMMSAAAAAVALAGAAIAVSFRHVVDIALALPAILFVLMIAYQGVRLGRSTHIVDMADEDRRASYTALSNTSVGILLLLGGLFGVIAQFTGAVTVLGLFAVMSGAAVFTAYRLREEQS